MIVELARTVAFIFRGARGEGPRSGQRNVVAPRRCRWSGSLIVGVSSGLIVVQTTAVARSALLQIDLKKGRENKGKKRRGFIKRRFVGRVGGGS